MPPLFCELSVIRETYFHVAAISVPIKQVDPTSNIESELACAKKTIMRLLIFKVTKNSKMDL